MMFGYGWNMSSGWGWIGMTVMMLFWFALLALLIYGLTRAFWGPARTTPTNPSDQDRADRAIVVLRERFARGEITEDEYRQVSNTLSDTAH